MKAFKYFDLNGNGTVEPSEFAKAIEKVGIMIPTKQVSIPLILNSPSTSIDGYGVLATITVKLPCCVSNNLHFS